ncbi:MAG: AMP-binding protein, partial [Actinomycetes bacterium]
MISASGALRPVDASPDERAVHELTHALAAALDGTGPAVLPLPGGGERNRVLDALRPDEPVEDEDLAAVVPTSGSTGEPKGVLLSAAALRASAWGSLDRLGAKGDVATWLLALPPHRVAGLQVLVRSLLAGTLPEVLDSTGGFRPESFADATERLRARGARANGPRYAALVPTQLVRLL